MQCAKLAGVVSAGQKWLAIWVDVLVYEVDHMGDGELLSEMCDRWIERHPIGARVLIAGFGGMLTLHLANLISPKYDTLSRHFWRRNYHLWKQLTS